METTNSGFLAVPALFIALLIGVGCMYFSDKLLQKVEHDQWAAVKISYAEK